MLTCVSAVFRCVAALELVSASCLHICKHDALAYASTMQKTHATISAICKYICTVLAWYLHDASPVFALYLHGSCMHMQVPCKYDKPPLEEVRLEGHVVESESE